MNNFFGTTFLSCDNKVLKKFKYKNLKNGYNP